MGTVGELLVGFGVASSRKVDGEATNIGRGGGLDHRFRDAFLHPRSGGDARDFAGSTRVGARFGSIVNSVVSRIGSGLRAAVQFGGSACTKKNRRAGAQNRGDVCEHQ